MEAMQGLLLLSYLFLMSGSLVGVAIAKTAKGEKTAFGMLIFFGFLYVTQKVTL